MVCAVTRSYENDLYHEYHDHLGSDFYPFYLPKINKSKKPKNSVNPIKMHSTKFVEPVERFQGKYK